MGVLRVRLKDGVLTVEFFDESGRKLKEEKYDKIVYLWADRILISTADFIVRDVVDYKVVVKGNMATVKVVR